MSSRIVEKGDKVVRKIIPNFHDLKDKKFPTLEEVDNNWETARERIEELLADVTPLTRSAVVQQYNEYLIYNETKDNIFAPIYFFSEDERNLPVLGFPVFTPLDNDENFYHYSDNECLVRLGYLSKELGIDYDEVAKFLNKVEEICNYFALRQDDIIFNLSNVGYSEEFGLRIIDYGLLESDKNKFELIW